MKILALTQYFPPETNAPAHRYASFVKHLSKNNEVAVICEPPNYPKGILFPGYKNKLFQTENILGARIFRAGVWISPKKNFINRALSYSSFFFSSILASFRTGKVDVILATCPPLPVIFAGYIISKIKRTPLVVDIRDIWPDSAVEVGMIKRNLLFKLLERFEKHIYKISTKIVVNAEGIGKRLIAQKGANPEKIVLVTNGAELELFKKNIDYSEIDSRYRIFEKYVALYTGLIGLAQSPEIIIETAKELQLEEDIVFLIVGEGALKKKCEELSNKYHLKNIIFAGERPREEMPAFAARANMAIIPYKNSELFKGVIPSKMFDYMAAEKPIIINLNGEGADIIKKANCGLIAEPEDPKSLADGIMKLKNDPVLSEKLGKNGRNYVEKYYDREKLAEILEQTLRSAI